MDPRSGSVVSANVPDESEAWVELGRISGAYGIKGWVKVYSYTRPRPGILDYDTWYLRDSDTWNAHRVIAGRAHGEGVVAKLSGSENRNDAERFVGSVIAVPRAALQAADSDEYYWRDLIGLRVVNTDGVDFGTVRELMETGANDVLVIDGTRTRLVPFTREVVVNVNTASGLIEVRWDSDF